MHKDVLSNQHTFFSINYNYRSSRPLRKSTFPIDLERIGTDVFLLGNILLTPLIHYT